MLKVNPGQGAAPCCKVVQQDSGVPCERPQPPACVYVWVCRHRRVCVLRLWRGHVTPFRCQSSLLTLFKAL